MPHFLYWMSLVMTYILVWYRLKLSFLVISLIIYLIVFRQAATNKVHLLRFQSFVGSMYWMRAWYQIIKSCNQHDAENVRKIMSYLDLFLCTRNAYTNKWTIFVFLLLCAIIIIIIINIIIALDLFHLISKHQYHFTKKKLLKD